MSTSTQRLFTRTTLWLAAALVVVFVVLLALMGRPALCKFGFGFYTPAWTHCTSQHFLDPYTLTHVLHGILFYWLLQPLASKMALHVRLVAALTLEIAWEILENTPWVIAHYRQDTAALDYTGDSILNALGDVIATVLGFVFAARVSWKASLAVIIAFELWALYLARDNLTLNILMFFFSMDGVKEWQLGG